MFELSLLIDQGNTRLKWRFARDMRLLPDAGGQGDFEAFRRALGEPGQQAPGRVLLSSVASAQSAQTVLEFSRSAWGVEARRLRSRAGQGGVRNAYAEPESLGVDRWLAIVGAVARYGKPLVVWDLGTATTIDAVDGTGLHLGGTILPGPETMLRSLDRDTGLNVPASLGDAQVGAGGNTAAAIRNGVLCAQLGALNQFLKAVAPRISGVPRLVLTGGAAESVAPALDFEFHHDPWLVFRGMLVD
jgi:type III pantothenate kinase